MFIPQKETSAEPLESSQTGLSEMVQHYLKTAKSAKSEKENAPPEEKNASTEKENAPPEKKEDGKVSKEQKGAAKSGDTIVEGKKEKGGEKKSKK